MSAELKSKLSELYTGASAPARRFRLFLMMFDMATIFYFIATATMAQTPAMNLFAAFLGILILLDFAARI